MHSMQQLSLHAARVKVLCTGKEKSHDKQTEEGFYNIMEIARKL